MEADPVASDDESPSLLWGLDPVFSAFARLYIKDILEMRESCQVPGIYIFNSHPIFQVDVLGIVVFRREREDFFSYGVDDGTGVINCLCWKNDKWRDQDEPVKWDRTVGASGAFNVEEHVRKLQQAQRCRSTLEIGDLIRVRGSVKTFRGNREIMSSFYYKVNDPVMEVQISWMMELPKLYQKCYLKPFKLPSVTTESSSTDGSGACFPSLLGQASQTLKDFLKEKEVKRFRSYDVEHLLHPLIPQLSSKLEGEQASAAGPSVPTQLRQLLTETLQLLQQEGTIFRKIISPDQLYNVTEQDKDLHMLIRDIIREDSKLEKYAEKGCHVLHIQSSARQRYSQNLSREVLDVALKFLECNSDIISTTDYHYTVL
ncbi:CST complex subunit STN1 [Denticeps clupeoides]|uniref:CST complex subunit STN1 n=1 Tax=Denticeps clupeoides TaxID=299321 RepID=A0AAY4EZY6_9TELE|nr:CST complex subunit STN1 [Denticeps clupeoides]